MIGYLLFLFLEFGIIAGKDETNIAIFVQKAKVALTEEHASAIDIDYRADDMVRKIRREVHYWSRDFLGSRYPAARNELVYWANLSSISKNI